MKRLTFGLLLLGALASACHRDDALFRTQTLEGTACYEITDPEWNFPDGQPIGIKNNYSVQWPAARQLTPQAERELMYCIFGDSTATDARQAADKWLHDIDFYQDNGIALRTIPSIDEDRDHAYANLKATCSRNGNLVTYQINTESFIAHAAHGMYTARNVIIDLDTRNIVHLSDLLTDTDALHKVIVRAIEDLDVNKDVREVLYLENEQLTALPIPDDFLIDSTRSVITLVYQVYDIACYAAGMQFVDLPIFWLSKHIPLTPYAKELFGPGCSID